MTDRPGVRLEVHQQPVDEKVLEALGATIPDLVIDEDPPVHMEAEDGVRLVNSIIDDGFVVSAWVGEDYSLEVGDCIGMILIRRPQAQDLKGRYGIRSRNAPPGGYARSWEITFLGVRPAQQRNGIGTLLLRRSVAVLHDLDPTWGSMWTNITEDDPRLSLFYARFEPQTVGYGVHPHEGASRAKRRLRFLWMARGSLEPLAPC